MSSQKGDIPQSIRSTDRAYRTSASLILERSSSRHGLSLPFGDADDAAVHSDVHTVASTTPTTPVLIFQIPIRSLVVWVTALVHDVISC